MEKEKKPNKRKQAIIAIAILIGISMALVAITLEIKKSFPETEYTQEEIQAYRDSFNEFFTDTNMASMFYHFEFENKAKDMNVTWEELYPYHEENRYYIRRHIDYLDEMNATKLSDNEIFLKMAYSDYNCTTKADLNYTLIELEDLLQYAQETNSTIFLDAFYISITVPKSDDGRFMKILYHCDGFCSMAYGYRGVMSDSNATDTNSD